MKLKMTLAMLTLMFLGSVLKAGVADTVRVDSKMQTIRIGKFEFKKGSLITDVKAALGEPKRVEKTALDVLKYLIYDDLGIAFELDRDEKTVMAISFTFNWDNDKKLANTAFKGVLLMDNYHITQNSSATDINTNTEVKTINCFMPEMCLSDMKNNSLIKVLMGYNKEKKIAAISYGFISAR